ncbi:hypothetical protein F4009_14870 [Candidatus Poribacteria bacterium]|nr:hypothetical protein [Candidatus Poribacteria bacterium]
MEEVAKSDYARYALEQRETEATEQRFEIVEKLLEKLPEGERTVCWHTSLQRKIVDILSKKEILLYLV